jgi:hypothetical protein
LSKLTTVLALTEIPRRFNCWGNVSIVFLVGTTVGLFCLNVASDGFASQL